MNQEQIPSTRTTPRFLCGNPKWEKTTKCFSYIQKDCIQ